MLETLERYKNLCDKIDSMTLELNELVLRNNFRYAEKLNKEIDILITEARKTLEIIINTVFKKLQKIIPDIILLIGYNGWNTVIAASASHSNMLSDIVIDDAIRRALPDKYRNYITFYAPNCYLTEDEAKEIESEIRNLLNRNTSDQ